MSTLDQAKSPSLLISAIWHGVLLAFAAAAASLPAQTVQVKVPELNTTAILTFEPVPGSPAPNFAATVDTASTHPSPAIAVTVDCLGHHQRFLRTPDNTMDPVSQTDANQIPGLKQDPSHLFLSTTGPRTLLFFFSQPDGSDPGALYVLGFHPDGRPYRVLFAPTFDLEAVEYDPGSTLRLVGKPTLSQAYGNDDGAPNAPIAITYDPYVVYVVQGDSPAVASLSLSKAYNLKHYVWSGPRMSEKIAVLYNIPGHPSPYLALDSQVPGIIAKAIKQRRQHP